MKKISYILLSLFVCMSVDAATPRARVGTGGRNVMPVLKQPGTIQKASVAVVVDEPEPYKKDMREKEREACLNNNIGMGNTFVWASKYSNTASYATMTEDTIDPENNVCFVKVNLKSDDNRIKVDDIQPKYFMWGDLITCGSWVDQSVLEKRILDGKKSARVWGTVGATVGGAALGVGAMELFGNELIGDEVEGQEALKGSDLLYSQIKSLDDNSGEYTEITTALKNLKRKCDEITDSKPDACSGDYYTVAEKLGL